MKALLAEYSLLHDPSLAPEGAAMYRTLKQSFEHCGYEVISPEKGDFPGELARLAPGCDVGLVIAPDHLIAGFARVLEDSTHNIGCDSMSAAVCANKRRCGKILASNGIAVPAEKPSGRRVIKPVRGCGSQGVRVSDGPAGDGEFGQEFIEGESFSVSLVGSRIVGEACLYYTGQPPLVLTLNRQDIRVREDGPILYLGGETPVDHPRGDEMVASAVKAIGVLGCQGYVGVDLVLADKPYVVDVNPRITTSIVGIAACMEEEIADILVRASRGTAPSSVRLNGRVRFTSAGQVMPA
jgi:predicted ATP-grasp superfamily ATP-dependent carboligase